MGAEVEVDTETGRITVLRCVEAIDVGQAINPRICRGTGNRRASNGTGIRPKRRTCASMTKAKSSMLACVLIVFLVLVMSRQWKYF